MDVKIPKSTQAPLINDFLDRNLRPEMKWSLKDEYPLAFSEANRVNMRIITEEDSVLAHAVLKPNIIKTLYHVFKVGFIGSVVTDEAHRGQGLSREIISSCLQASERQDCDFAMLWTDLFNFYSKLGFEIAGQEIALRLNPQSPKVNNNNLKFLETPKVSPQALLNLYNKHSLRTQRNVQDISQYLNIPGSKVFTAWNNATNGLEAYAVIGKGADFQNYVHEWGGGVSAITSLLQHIQGQQAEPITIIAPPESQNLIRTLEKNGATISTGILGMIKITNPASLCKKIKKGARSQGIDDFVCDYREGQYFFGCGEDVYQTDSDQDMVRLIFGPLKPEQIHNFSEKTLETLNKVFPIAFWVWGWDSI